MRADIDVLDLLLFIQYMNIDLNTDTTRQQAALKRYLHISHVTDDVRLFMRLAYIDMINNCLIVEHDIQYFISR